MTIEPLSSIPPDLQRRNRDVNLLWYHPSEILVAREEEQQHGAIRYAQRNDPTVQHGLLADLQVDTTLEKGMQHQTEDELIKAAEQHLRAAGATKVDAIVRDGERRSEPYQRNGYWPFRKTVVIEWDLEKWSPLPTQHVVRQATSAEAEQLTNFVLHSYQPYWQWWMDEQLEKPWLRTDYAGVDTSTQTAAAGERHRQTLNDWFRNIDPDQQVVFVVGQDKNILALCDVHLGRYDQFDFGVLISYSAAGTGSGAAAMAAALSWLKERGQTRARIITTSGMDDYDPTVYLYVQKLGGKIVAEYLDLVKKL